VVNGTSALEADAAQGDGFYDHLRGRQCNSDEIRELHSRLFMLIPAGDLARNHSIANGAVLVELREEIRRRGVGLRNENDNTAG
jgi:hypothetical protein